MKEYWQKIREFFANIFEFLKETRKELNNVSWPSRRELTGTTMVVIIAVFFFGFFLWVIDTAVNSAMNYIFHQALQ